MSDIALAGLARRGAASTAAKRTAFRHVLAAEVLFGAEAYETLKADWQRLAALQDGAVLFQMPALLDAWAQHFTGRRGVTPVTVVVRSEDRTILIWPLCLKRHGLFKVAKGACAPISQYDDILLDPDYDAKAALTAAMDALKDSVRPDLVSLERVRADSALRAGLNGAEPLSWAEGAPYTDLSQGMEGVWSTRKPRVARQQRKRVRALARRHDVGFAIATGPDEAEAWLEEALALKRDWLQQTGRVSRAFMQPETAKCLTALARACVGEEAVPRVVVAKLTLDGETAAMEAGFCQNGVYHLYLGTYAPKFAKLGPGNALTQRVLEWCVDSGMTRYDMLAPRSRNKSEWQTNEVAIVDFALPVTLLGRFYTALVLKRVAPALRNTFYALPPRVRALAAGLVLRRMRTG